VTKYLVQYTLPCDNPVNSVSMKRGKGVCSFQVPINHPDAHRMGFSDLLAAAELSGLIDLFTPHNKKTGKSKDDSQK